jgi:hypothetical protein
MRNEPQIRSGRNKSRPYIAALLLCLVLNGCGGNLPLALPAHYACVALPAAGGAAVIDLTIGAEKLLGYVKAANQAGPSVACGGGRLYLASRDNRNLYIYDIAEALGNTGDRLPTEPSSFGLKSVVLIDADIGGLALDHRRGLLYVVSHSTKEGPTFNLLTIVQGTSKLTSLALPADVSGTTLPQLSPDGSRLYIPAPAAGLLLTVQVSGGYNVLGSVPLRVTPGPPPQPSPKVGAGERMPSPQIREGEGTPQPSPKMGEGVWQVNADGTISDISAFFDALNLPGAQYVAYSADKSRAYVSYKDGLAIVNMGNGKVERTIKLAGGPPAQIVRSEE